MTELSRRSLLRGKWRQRSSAIRPPWSIDELAFIEGCTRCNACITACETQVIVAGSGGYPELDFQRAECTFCQRCVQACAEPVFKRLAAVDKLNTAPWQLKALIGSTCLTEQGIECRSCQDSCEPYAISFKLRSTVAQPVLDGSRCNGCGACVRSCPANAIRICAPNNDE